MGSSALAWQSRRVLIFNGQYDTRIRTGDRYETIELAEFFTLQPANLPKARAPAFIASTYHEHDGREHRVQREKGSFVALAGDVDRGNHALEEIEAVVGRIAHGAAWLIYSSAHATSGDMRWRIILPLAQPLDFSDWYDAQTAFFDFMEANGVEMDRALGRAAQPVYLPNVPSTHQGTGEDLRGADGRPLYFASSSSAVALPGLRIDDGPMGEFLASLRQRKAEDERHREQLRAHAERRRAEHRASGDHSIIDGFNRSVRIADLLKRYDYTQSPRNDLDWRSPNQSSPTFATRIIGDKWVSLSSTDAGSGLGAVCSAGCFGDAFDLFVHFEHGGDQKRAWRQLCSERDANQASGANKRGEPRPEAGQASDGPFASGSEDASGGKRGHHVTATPYVWRDPNTLPRRPWLYGRQLLRGSVFVLIAPGATGKSALMAGTALCLCTARALLGQAVWDGPKRVWIWNLEDSLADLEFAIQAAALHWGIDEQDIAGRLFVDSGLDGATLKLARMGRAGPLIDGETSAAIQAEIIRREIDVLIIDPFISSHGLNDENDNAAIDLVAKEWARIATASRCAIVLVHHSKKLNGGEVTAESSRGASALVDAARGGLTLNTMTKPEAEGFGIDLDQRRRFFRADDAKPNRAPPGAGQWFELGSVLLGNGPEGGDSVGVATPWSAPDPFDNVSIRHLRQVQARIAEGAWRENIQAADWAGKVVAEVLDLDLEMKANKQKAKKVLRTWIANGALRVVEQADRNGDLRKFVVVGGAA